MRVTIIIAAVVVVSTLGLTACGGGGGSATADAQLAADNVRSAMPSAEAYYADHDSYAGMSSEILREQYDGALPDISVDSASDEAYCIEETVGEETFKAQRPGGEVERGSC